MIAIKTMNKLPEECEKCPCYATYDGHCQADDILRTSIYRPFWCPLTLVEEESGICIRQDADSISFFAKGTAADGFATGAELARATLFENVQRRIYLDGLMTEELKAFFNSHTPEELCRREEEHAAE